MNFFERNFLKMSFIKSIYPRYLKSVTNTDDGINYSVKLVELDESTLGLVVPGSFKPAVSLERGKFILPKDEDTFAYGNKFSDGYKIKKSNSVHIRYLVGIFGEEFLNEAEPRIILKSEEYPHQIAEIIFIIEREEICATLVEYTEKSIILCFSKSIVSLIEKSSSLDFMKSLEFKSWWKDRDGNKFGGYMISKTNRNIKAIIEFFGVDFTTNYLTSGENKEISQVKSFGQSMPKVIKTNTNSTPTSIKMDLKSLIPCLLTEMKKTIQFDEIKIVDGIYYVIGEIEKVNSHISDLGDEIEILLDVKTGDNRLVQYKIETF